MQDAEEAMLKWRKPQTEGRRVSARGGHAAAVVGSDLLFFGGHCYGGKGKFDYYSDTMALDLETNTWHKVRTGGRAPTARYGHRASVVGERMYIFGGSGPNGKLHNEVFFLDTTTWCWVEVTATNAGPRPRFNHAQTLVGDKIVIHGGWNGTECFDDMWIFDTATSTWIEPQVSGKPPSARQGHNMELTFDGRIIVFAGSTMNEGGYPGYLNDVWSLDIETMVWTRPGIAGDVVEPRMYAASCMLGKYFICIGGFILRKDKQKRLEAEASDGVGQRIKNPIRADRIIALDTEKLEWFSPQFFGNCPDDSYGQSISLAADQVILYGGWGGNRALDELFVGQGLGAIELSLEEQRAEAEREELG
ncbi:Kelch domain-containing protein 3 [Hondaea fermentalgiana]|uniref:Kelch domain-containing protein 3 n=1 Tax=Hondaea fermentalgiana TaxID=2315210 RepID=A0A2R5GME4_9STRA|nr:Kelch domain-containing protein 3 [Hondaea fermentalgiana]|eukprot:GBG30908.1 Kelch domain-containing protein 3 [Hondaea fermentalgiana]